MKSMMIGKVTKTDKLMKAADLDGDGKLTITDVNLLKRMLIGQF